MLFQNNFNALSSIIQLSLSYYLFQKVYGYDRAALSGTG